MIPKKNPKIDLEQYKTIFFLIGLAISIGVSILIINIKTYDKPVEEAISFHREIDDDIIIPITKVVPPAEPKPPAPEVIRVVEDQVRLEVELDIMSTETNQEEVVDWFRNEPVSEISEVQAEEEVDEVMNFELVETVPVFPGCEGAVNNDQRKACFQEQIMLYVSKNFAYPRAALEMNIQGRVFLRFVVEKDGSISNIEVLRGVDPILDEEAIRVIQSLPRIEPAKQRGKPVRMSFVMPINAKLHQR